MSKNDTLIIGMLRIMLDRIDSLENKLSQRCKLTADDARVWTPKDVTRLFGLGDRQQYNLRQSGALPYIQKYKGGPITYLPPDVIGYFMGENEP